MVSIGHSLVFTNRVIFDEMFMMHRLSLEQVTTSNPRKLVASLHADDNLELRHILRVLVRLTFLAALCDVLSCDSYSLDCLVTAHPRAQYGA